MEEIVKKFIIKEMLGRKVDVENSDNVIKKCIGKAYNSMLSAGRFQKIKNKEILVNQLFDILKKNNYYFDRKIIDEYSEIIEENIENDKKMCSYGLAQKVVNMSFKYFYVFKEYIEKNEKINFTNCDCPIDSIILSQIGLKKIKWSKITKEEYIECQNIIDNKIQVRPEKELIGRLIYDFDIW